MRSNKFHPPEMSLSAPLLSTDIRECDSSVIQQEIILKEVISIPREADYEAIKGGIRP